MIRSSFRMLGMLALMVFSLANFSRAAETMTQGEFALWLVKEVGALKQLSPAASAQDAINFLTSLGIVPEDGWKKDAPADDKFMSSLLPNEDAMKNETGKSLQDRVLELVRSRFDSRSTGVFRVQSASASSPS